MSEARQILETIIDNFSVESFSRFFREKSRHFVARKEDYSQYNDDDFKSGSKLGEINFSNDSSVLICAFEAKKPLSERAGKKAQYEKAKYILKSRENQQYSAGIFIFYDSGGNFRFSLIYPESIGTKRQWNNFRRFTYFVSDEFTNKTFLKQIGDKEFSRIDDVKSAFSITAVTNIFYDEFFRIYGRVVEETIKINKIEGRDKTKASDFVLLFAIRSVFLGFIQKKKWIGGEENFIQNFFKEYEVSLFGKNEFYSRWLSPLFFEALNSPLGSKVAYGNNDFSTETESKLQMAPFLNGGLFKSKQDYDTNGWKIPDKEIKDFFEFLFSHSFTIEENSLNDEDLQLNPEFLGIIFERLVNKADGAVYTPRTEVDLMCRWTLLKWLQKNLENNVNAHNLYELFFKESEKEEDQKGGSFSPKEAQEILDKLGNLSICDPAVGSGAFLVGMMQVLDDVEQSLKRRYDLNGKELFERKKQIIKDSLYGVEVKEWAVWICQLRLWLSLFVDAPDDLKNSLEPILPSLDFKVRQGDSLVQRIGSKAFPVSGHNLTLSKAIKDKITKLKNLKLQYFDNKSELKEWELRQRELAIYEEIVETEIREKENEVRNLKNIKPTKVMSLFGDEEKPEQQGFEFDKEKIEEFEIEITELKEQKKVLRKDKPLVWGIEFADVFGEKGGFDIIIGNPPYVRQEDIADPTGKIKDKKEYKNCLEEMVKLDFPDDFPPRSKINAQSDLYTYFYIRGLRLLNSQGIHTFICSNSWLDVGYGIWLQKFLLERAPVELIIDNHAKRSFEAADVNTIISIIHAPQKKVDENHSVKFIAFKKPFEETVFTENLLAIENAEKVESGEVFRVYPITTRDLKEAGTEYEKETDRKLKLGKYIGDKWGGKFLRAPDIFFTILEKGKNKLVKLGDIADVRFGIKTGVNEFFYLSETRIKEWEIEEEFIRPVIKSPRECRSILVNPKDLKYKIFICNKNKEDLKGTNALKYIEWGEKLEIIVKQGRDEGKIIKGVQNISSVKGRSSWYSLGSDFGANMFIQMTFNDSFPFYCADDAILADARLYEIKNKEGEWKDLCLSLNSTLSVLFMELYGRANLGEGALDFKVYEAKNILLANIKNLNDKISFRMPRSIFEECGIDIKSDTPIEEQEPKPLPDRAELDRVVFDTLGLTKDERKELYRAVCRLVWNRISKARSV